MHFGEMSLGKNQKRRIIVLAAYFGFTMKKRMSRTTTMIATAIAMKMMRFLRVEWRRSCS